MNFRILKASVVVSVLLASTNCLQAQSPAPKINPVPLPSGKLLAPAPENAQWIIDITAVPPGAATPGVTKARSAASPKPRATKARPATSPKPSPRITVAKSGSIKHVTGIVFNGTTEELWIDGATEVMLAPGMERPAIFDDNGSVDPYYTKYCRADFPGFEWISAGNFAGESAYGSRKCLVFRAVTKVDVPASDATGETAPALAYIDEETRLPISLEKNGQTLLFQFGDPPNPPISLPPELEAALTARKNHVKDLTRSPDRPY